MWRNFFISTQFEREIFYIINLVYLYLVDSYTCKNNNKKKKKESLDPLISENKTSKIFIRVLT